MRRCPPLRLGKALVELLYSFWSNTAALKYNAGVNLDAIIQTLPAPFWPDMTFVHPLTYPASSTACADWWKWCLCVSFSGCMAQLSDLYLGCLVLSVKTSVSSVEELQFLKKLLQHVRVKCQTLGRTMRGTTPETHRGGGSCVRHGAQRECFQLQRHHNSCYTHSGLRLPQQWRWNVCTNDAVSRRSVPIHAALLNS